MLLKFNGMFPNASRPLIGNLNYPLRKGYNIVNIIVHDKIIELEVGLAISKTLKDNAFHRGF